MELVKHTTITEMAEAYSAAMEKISGALKAIEESSESIRRAFSCPETSGDFGVYVSTEYHRAQPIDKNREQAFRDLETKFRRKAWSIIADRLNLRMNMSIKGREEFDKQITEGELPELTAESIARTIRTWGESVNEFGREAVREVFDYLRGRGKFKSVENYRVGPKVILTTTLTRWCDSWNVGHYSQKFIMAIDRCFHLLDGQGVPQDYCGPLVSAIRSPKAQETSAFETTYFRGKCFKNGNLHLWFKKPELVKELNYIACGDRVLGSEEK